MVKEFWWSSCRRSHSLSECKVKNAHNICCYLTGEMFPRFCVFFLYQKLAGIKNSPTCRCNSIRGNSRLLFHRNSQHVWYEAICWHGWRHETSPTRFLMSSFVIYVNAQLALLLWASWPDRGYRCGSPTAVRPFRLGDPLWEPSPSHPILL